MKNGFTGRGYGWTDPMAVHITLKFLGEIDDSMIEDISRGMKDASKTVPPFTIKGAGAGGFPNLKNPRVIWFGIEENSSLSTLQAEVDKQLAVIGFPREDRPFRPHLTLCRVREGADGRALGDFVGRKAPEKVLDFRAESFILFESRLNPKGAVYTALRTFTLKG